MLPSVPALFLAFAAILASTVSALPAPHADLNVNVARAPEYVQWTNARRMAVGLPPLAPRMKRFPTPTEPGLVARHVPSASPSPLASAPVRLANGPTTYTGRVEARTVADGSSLGFLRLSSSGVTLGSYDEASSVTFTAPASNTPFDVVFTDSGMNLGAVGTVQIASGLANANTLEVTEATSAHARPAKTGGESAIWRFSTTSAQLTPNWVNPDGSHARTTKLGWVPSDATTVVGGDIDAYSAAHPAAPAVEMALFFMSD
ncbi:uncharacterized protein BXZ73DRAFT_81832 [Epithele typhae]|uniref:uncharacterized protein n=1 Tax=Epithele typhae TaxID=378194 RepID=UPI002007370B|nr:uncharacterized protein BXZ73DRAFT_81832 [Epithele typhae]KAH9913807.1 hypothetical protein BXZ73DRAFT_81832 [Epithele typhae]